MDDGEIVELFLRRDETAVARASEKYGKRLRDLAERITGDIETALECENDTYLRAWNSIPPNKPADCLFSFLARITRNVSINVLKSGKCKKRGGETVELTTELESCLPAEGDVETAFEEKEISGLITEYLKSIGERKRSIFLKRYWYAEPISEIADEFSTSEGNVRSVLSRTRSGLKRYLEKEGYKP